MPCWRVVSPKSTSPNPASAAPAPDRRPLARSLISAPTKTIGRAAAVSETRTPISATSQPVPVVPTFAPKTRPNPCGNVNKPALTTNSCHSGCAGRLHQERDECAPEGAAQWCRCSLAKHCAQRRAGQCLQAICHDGHAEQKETNAANY